MRSQLSFIRRVVCSLYVLLLFGHSVSLAADKYTVEGVVEGADGKAQIKLTEGVKDYDDKIKQLTLVIKNNKPLHCLL